MDLLSRQGGYFSSHSATSVHPIVLRADIYELQTQIQAATNPIQFTLHFIIVISNAIYTYSDKWCINNYLRKKL